MNPRTEERRRVVRATIANPVLLIAHSWECCSFLLAYARNKIRRRFARDIHQVGKRRPAWLPTVPAREGVASASQVGELTFPNYPRADVVNRADAGRIEAAADPPDDIEVYFARHRWSACQDALMGSESDAAAAVRECVDWLRVPLPKSDPAWEPYSASERVANLLALLAACPAARQHISEDVLRHFLDDSRRWIEDHLEFYGSRRTNNHILNDARALVMTGAVLRNQLAVEHGLLLFARMGGELFQTGGFLRERSAHYQVVVTNWLLDTVHFARFAAVASPQADQSLRALEELAVRVVHATAVLRSHLDACDTFIGDISPDSAPALSRERLDRLYSSWMPSPDQIGDGRIDDWVFVSRHDQRIVACTVANTFPLPFVTHGHSDVTHFVWRWRGTCVLADAGRARYTKDPASLAQADARGHNVVLIDGLGPLAESLVNGGQWQLRPYSNATVQTRVETASFSVTHDGFRRLRAGVGTHARTVSVIETGIAIEDHIEGTGTVTLDLLWHFAPRLSPVRGGAAVSGEGIVVTCASETSTGEGPARTWQAYPHSSAYGETTPASVLQLRWVVSLPCTIRTTMSVSPCAA